MQAAGDLAHLLEQPDHLADCALQPPFQLPGSRRDRCPRLPQLQGEGDQPLLDAIVQVAPDAAARLVAGGHDPRSGGGQRRLRLGVGDRGADQLGEPGQPVLGAGRQRPSRRPVRRHGRTLVPLTQRPGGLRACKMLLSPAEPDAELRTHEGYEWMYVPSGCGSRISTSS